MSIFKIKADLWKRVKELSKNKNIPINIQYQESKISDIENELQRLTELEPAESKIKTKKIKKNKVNEWRRYKMLVKKLNQPITLKYSKATAEQLNNINNELKESIQSNEINAFFNNPFNDSKINITDKKINNVINSIVLNPDFNLLLEMDNTYLTINMNNLQRLKDAITSGFIENVEQGGSDVEIINNLINPNTEIYLLWKIKQRERATGGYFQYYNITDIDLSPYGIYKNIEEVKEKNYGYDLNCLELALSFDNKIFNKVRPLINTRYIAQKDIKIIAETLKINIHIWALNIETFEVRKTKYEYNEEAPTATSFHEPIPKGIRSTSVSEVAKNPVFTYDIGLIDKHYFIINKTEYTSYAIDNYDEIKHIKNFNKIYKKEGKKYKFINTRFINSFDLIKKMFINKNKYFEPITLKNCGTFNNFTERFKDYEELTLSDNDKQYKLMDSNLILDLPEIKYFKNEPYEVVYFDTETTTEGEIHKPYLLCAEGRDDPTLKKDFMGEFCIINWLKYLSKDKLKNKNFICIAHNLRYDVQFMIPYLMEINDLIKTGNRIKLLSGMFFNKDNNNTIKIIFKDSISFIDMPLKNFKKCFNIEGIKKEIMPYHIYTEKTIKQKYISLNQNIKNHLNDNYDEFIQNIKNWNLLNPDNENEFNHIEYSRIYCYQDVNILKQGYQKFREWMLNVTKLDIDKGLSIPQIAHTYGIMRGVFNDCYKISGVERDFIQKCIIGGRCMTRRNEKFEINHDVDDFDGVSLYPSSMYLFNGFLKGKPKLWNDTIDIMDEKITGYFIEININDVKKYRDYPLLSKKNEEGIRNFDNNIRGRGIFVDKYGLEDLIKYQNIEYTIIRGYYFDEGYNTNVKDFIKELFEERLKKKKEGNPVESVYKLLMNSFYGKLIQKPLNHDFKFIYGKNKFEKYLSYNFNSIDSYTKIKEGIYYIKIHRCIKNHFSAPHLGSEILSYSKRIMNNVMTLAEDLNIEIYYQDTDSMHIDARIREDKKTGIELLNEEYIKLYNKSLIGKGMGEFHSDFSYESKTSPISEKSIYLGKKSYIDKVRCTDKEGKISYINHIRLKGIPTDSIKKLANKKYNGDSLKLYKALLEGKSETFDLVDFCKFKSVNNWTTINNEEFKRTVKF